VSERIGLDLGKGRRCGSFSGEQRAYLDYHRNAVFEKSSKEPQDALSNLLSSEGY
jgi:hypothetical protein